MGNQTTAAETENGLMDDKKEFGVQTECCDSLNELRTPCFIVNTNKFCDIIKEFNETLHSCFQSPVLAYSVKTNSLPYLLSLARAQGMYAEIGSEDEYALVRKVGFPIDKIIYNGPLKSRETFVEAVRGGATVNIETKRELDWLDDLDGTQDYNIGIRLNIDLWKLCPSGAVAGKNSRFGFDAENGELQDALSVIRRKGIRIKGIHLHRSTTTRSPEVYEAICRYANKIIKDNGLKLSYVDIGGGFSGKMPGKPGYHDYANAIRNSLDCENLTVIFEPGYAVLADPIDYMMRVIDRKTVGDARILTCDGTRMDIDAFYQKENYNYEFLDVQDRKRETVQQLCGCTCMEGDRIFTVENEYELDIGDKIILYGEGAYTMTYTPNFIRFQPDVYAYDGTHYVLVRKKWGASEFMQNSVYIPPHTEA